MFEKRYWVQILPDDSKEWKTVKRSAMLSRALNAWKEMVAESPSTECRVIDKQSKEVIASNHQIST